MSALMANLAVAASVLLAGVALLMAIVGFLAYRRVEHPRLLWIAMAFVAMFLQGAYLIEDSYARRGDIDSLPMLPLLGLAVVVALYLAVLKR